MSDEDATGAAETAKGSGNPLGLDDRTMAIVGVAAVAAVVLVLAGERDVARRDFDRIRGPRWLWHAIGSTPPGLVLYSVLGIKGPPKPAVPSLEAPTVTKYAG